MGRFLDAISAVLSKLAEWLHLKPSEAHRLERMEEKLAGARRDNADRLEALKDEMRTLERRALHKKKELDQARGDSKRIVAGEIERVFRELDRLHQREKIIARNIEKVSIAQSKVGELRAAQAQGVDESQLDDLALELQQAFEELKVSDRAVRDLEQVEYEPPQATHVDVPERVAEVTGAKETASGLSEQTANRLKQLEAEVE